MSEHFDVFAATPPASAIDLEFARRSARYLVENRCTPSEIVDMLTTELGLSPEAAHHLVGETTALVAA